MNQLKNIYNHSESLFDLKEITAICKQFGADFEAFDVECNTSDEAILLNGKLLNATPETILSIVNVLRESGNGTVAIDLKGDDLLVLSVKELPETATASN